MTVIDQFFKDNPNAQCVWQIGEGPMLYLAEYNKLAEQHANVTNQKLVRVNNPNFKKQIVPTASSKKAKDAE